jgi:hypothetical protein
MNRRKDAFLVNLWVESEEGQTLGNPRWRGSVEHLATRRRLYFNDLTELVAILATSTRPQEAD